MKNNKLEIALEYVDRGWYVMPLHTPMENGTCSCGEPNCDKIGKHPRVFFKEGRKAIVEQTQEEHRENVIQWFSQWPDANIAILTGPESGLLVLDVDGEAGQKSIEKLEIPDCPQVKTGNGIHYYFKYPEHTKKAITVGSDYVEGIDMRGSGGFVVAAGSVHKSRKS